MAMASATAKGIDHGQGQRPFITKAEALAKAIAMATRKCNMFSLDIDTQCAAALAAFSPV